FDHVAGSTQPTTVALTTSGGQGDIAWWILAFGNAVGHDVSGGQPQPSTATTNITCPSVTPGDAISGLLLSIYAATEGNDSPGTITVAGGQTSTGTQQSDASNEMSLAIGYETI